MLLFFVRSKLVQHLKGKRLTFELELVDISTTVASVSCSGLILAVSKVYKLTTLKPGLQGPGKLGDFFLFLGLRILRPKFLQFIKKIKFYF